VVDVIAPQNRRRLLSVPVGWSPQHAPSRNLREAEAPLWLSVTPVRRPGTSPRQVPISGCDGIGAPSGRSCHGGNRTAAVAGNGRVQGHAIDDDGSSPSPGDQPRRRESARRCDRRCCVASGSVREPRPRAPCAIAGAIARAYAPTLPSAPLPFRCAETVSLPTAAALARRWSS
jgi:hypothetical protein